jgi:hypothetical protein
MYLPQKIPEPQHVPERQFRTELGIEIAACGFREPVAVSLLRLVIHRDGRI